MVSRRLRRASGGRSLPLGRIVIALVIATYDPENPRSQGSAQIAALIGQLVNMKFGRDDELQSDRLGVQYMAEVGYDPRSLIRVMEILAEASEGNRPLEFFSTHPCAPGPSYCSTFSSGRSPGACTSCWNEITTWRAWPTSGRDGTHSMRDASAA